MDRQHVLKVMIDSGRVILDGGRVNYAWGNLDTFFREAFARAGIPAKHHQRVLIIGFGVGNVATILHQQQPQAEIVGVEPSKDVLELGCRWFGLQDIPHLRLHTMAGEQYLQQAKEPFDLIVVDAFVEEQVPEALQTMPALKKMATLLRKDGVLFFNSLGYREELAAASKVLLQQVRQVLPKARAMEVLGNAPIVAKK